MKSRDYWGVLWEYMISLYNIIMLASYFHVPTLTAKPREGLSSIRPMIANVEVREAACSVRWARALTILFRSLWQDGLEVRQHVNALFFTQ